MKEFKLIVNNEYELMYKFHVQVKDTKSFIRIPLCTKELITKQMPDIFLKGFVSFNEYVFEKEQGKISLRNEDDCLCVYIKQSSVEIIKI